MDTIFGNRHVWQCILEFATDGAFILGASRPDTPILTHTLASLRATCRNACELIPAPTRMSAMSLLYEGATIGNMPICQLAFARIMALKRDNKFPKGINASGPFLIAASNGHLNVIRFLQDIFTFEDDVFIDYPVAVIAAKTAAINNHLSMCEMLHPNFKGKEIRDAIVEGAAFVKSTSILEWAKKQYGFSYQHMFAGAVAGGHIDLCEAALNSGEIPIQCAIATVACHECPKIRALLKDWIRRSKSLDVLFYTYTMLDCLRKNDNASLRLLHEWSVEDNVQPEYSVILNTLAMHIACKNRNAVSRDDRDTFALLCEFCRQIGFHSDRIMSGVSRVPVASELRKMLNDAHI